MNRIAVHVFQKALLATHAAHSELLERVPVLETFQGRTVWDGEVLVFRLLDHSTAPKCYAWEVDGRVTAVLHEPPVDSPRKAVQAAIAAEYRSRATDG